MQIGLNGLHFHGSIVALAQVCGHELLLLDHGCVDARSQRCERRSLELLVVERLTELGHLMPHHALRHACRRWPVRGHIARAGLVFCLAVGGAAERRREGAAEINDTVEHRRLCAPALALGGRLGDTARQVVDGRDAWIRVAFGRRCVLVAVYCHGDRSAARSMAAGVYSDFGEEVGFLGRALGLLAILVLVQELVEVPGEQRSGGGGGLVSFGGRERFLCVA